LFGKIKIENDVQGRCMALKGDESSALIFSLAAYHVSFRNGQVFQHHCRESGNSYFIIFNIFFKKGR